MAAIALQPDDFGNVKLKPVVSPSAFPVNRALPEDSWKPPANPPKPFVGRPVDGGVQIELIQPWAEYRIDLRTNLFDALVTAVEGLFQSFTALLAGEITQALRDAAQKIRDLISDIYRQWEITWECKFEAEENVTLLVKHLHDYSVNITRTAKTSGRDRMAWLIDTRLAIDSQILEDARITVDGKKTKVETATEYDLASVLKGERVVRSQSLMRLDCEGFLKDLGTLFDSIFKVIEEGIDLQRSVEEYMVGWIKRQTSYWSRPSQADTEAERERRQRSESERIKAQIKSLAKVLLDQILLLLQEYKGLVALDTSTIEVTALSDAGVKRVRELLHQESKKEKDKHTDSRLKSREALLRSAPGVLVAGRNLLPEAEWEAMGLDGSAFYFEVVPVEAIESALVRTIRLSEGAILEGGGMLSLSDRTIFEAGNLPAEVLELERLLGRPILGNVRPVTPAENDESETGPTAL
jgi:hypothetical protein